MGLPSILANSIGRDIEEIYVANNKGEYEAVNLLERITMATRDCVTEFVKDRTGIDGRIGRNPISSLIRYTGFYQEPWVRALEGGEFRKSDGLQLVALFKYLQFCLEQVVKDNELGALQKALEGALPFLALSCDQSLTW